MKTVLVVDDDNEILNMVRVVLEEKGLHVATSSDGKAAMRDIIAKHPDLIVMDIRMPNMDGLNALDLLRVTQLNRDVPILMWSGEPDPETVAKAERLGADEVIDKSMPMPDFATRVTAYLFTVEASHVADILKRAPASKAEGVVPDGMTPEQVAGWDVYPMTFGDHELCLFMKPDITPETVVAGGAEIAAGKLEIHHRLPKRWRRVWPKR